MLASLPGIGAARAATLLAEFGSVRGVLEADPKRLRRVEGIGRALATYLASLGRHRGPPPRESGNDSGEGADRVSESAPAYPVLGTCFSNSR
jgi:ERCC4-type nuclease